MIYKPRLQDDDTNEVIVINKRHYIINNVAEEKFNGYILYKVYVRSKSNKVYKIAYFHSSFNFSSWVSR